MEHWLEIIQQALSAEITRTGSPVSGAKLRSEVAKIARSNGWDFPPPDVPKFSSLISLFPASLLILRRPGSDFVVVPTDRPELLTGETDQKSSSGSRLRVDIFDALTRIPTDKSGKPHYIPSGDCVVWSGSLSDMPAEAIELPSSSFESEIAIRKAFCVSTEVPEPRPEPLEAALKTKTPLKDFTQTLHTLDLVGEWHRFRLAALIDQLKAWATENSVNWGASWVDTSESRKVYAPSVAPVFEVDNRHALANFIAELSSDDLRRVTLPLDLVLRLLAKR